MREQSTREARDEQLSEQSREAFEKHEIVESGEGRWLLRAPYEDGEGWKAQHWTEIVALYWGGLLVTGDIDSAIFRYGPRKPRALVSWMASRKSASDHYFMEKASIGGGGIDATNEWDRDVARDDIRELWEDEWHGYESLRAELEGVRKGDLDSRDVVLGELCELGIDSELLGGIGMVTSSHLYCVHAALQRLWTLLQVQDAEVAA